MIQAAEIPNRNGLQRELEAVSVVRPFFVIFCKINIYDKEYSNLDGKDII